MKFFTKLLYNKKFLDFLLLIYCSNLYTNKAAELKNYNTFTTILFIKKFYIINLLLLL